MPPYRAVLFDFFGTLTYAVTGDWGRRRVARLLGCDPAELAGVLDRTYHDRARGRFGDPEATLRRVCRRLGVDPAPGQLRAARLARLHAVRAELRLRPYAVEVLTTLRARGVRTAVVSDCDHDLPVLLPTLPVARLLDARVLSVEVGECKPHPVVYATACRLLRVDPGQCLYLGDGDGRELTGADRAGMHPVRLAAPDLTSHRAFLPDHDFRGPTVSSLAEVVDLLARPRRPGPCLR